MAKKPKYDNIKRRIAPWLERVVRPAWIPVVEEGDGSLDAHKFSGRPWLAPDEDWPSCPGCEQPFQLFLQLNMSALPDLPDLEQGDGLFQLFYCRDDNHRCSASEATFEPFSESHLLRIVSPTGKVSNVRLPDDPAYYPAKRIVGWDKVDDWPVISDFETCGLSYEWTMDRTTLLRWEELDFEIEIPDDDFKEFEKKVMPCHTGEKLYGWPYWLQDPQRPDCSECGQPMQYLFQFDSLERNIPYSFGDSGTGQVHQCATHKEVLAFGWAGC